MRKAERLFQLVNILRSRRSVITARQIADLLEVSERTVYRDIQALSLSGIPIEGEAGVGYRIRPGFDLPPIMFELDELEALRFGVRMVQAWAGKSLGQSATRALEKIQAALPDTMHRDFEFYSEPLVVSDTRREQFCQYSDEVHASIRGKQKLEIAYRDESNQPTQRIIWPMGLVYWGSTWTIVAWCELRDDYRMFRLDRIQALTVLESHFQAKSDQSLEHYLSQFCEES